MLEGHKVSLNSGRTNGLTSLWRYWARSMESPAGISTGGRLSALKRVALTPRFCRLYSLSATSSAGKNNAGRVSNARKGLETGS